MSFLHTQVDSINATTNLPPSASLALWSFVVIDMETLCKTLITIFYSQMFINN